MATVDRNISKFDDNKRGLAKLMARENITVQIIDGVPTAKFDTVNRVLTLPNWPFLHVDQLDTQIGHEVGHALFTDNSYLERVARRRKDTTNLFTYINVVEDARIERKIREAYPGMKQVFYNGRKLSTEKGPLFQISGTKHLLMDGKKIPVAKLSFIDRINLFYKIGAFIHIPMTAAEQPWIERINRCYSTENACDIAEELYELAKEEEKERARQEQEEKNQQGKPQPGQKGEKGDKQKGKQKSKDTSTESGDGDDSDDSGDDKASNKSKPKSKPKSKEQDAGDDADDADESGASKGDDKSDDSSDDSDGASDDDSKGSGDASGDDAEGESDDSSDDSADGGSGGGDDADDDAPESGASGDASEDDSDGESSKQASTPVAQASNAQAHGSTEPEPDPVSKTDELMTKALQELIQSAHRSAATQIKHLLLKPVDAAEVKARTVSAADWTARCEEYLKTAHQATDIARLLSALESGWNSRYLSTAKHMAAEFQRRKTARQLQAARIGKTGKLDVNRLHAYRFADDLFKRVMIVPNGQSHGIIMMIDGSSSMNAVFANVLDQVLLFARFAFQVNIPFECYMFTDRTDGMDRNLSLKSAGPQAITLPGCGRLVGLINTVSDRSSFKRQVRMVLTMRSTFSNDLAVSNVAIPRARLPYAMLGGTPLYAGMMLMERHMKRMKETLKLDKMIGLVVSDGGDTEKLFYNAPIVNQTTGAVEFGSYTELGSTAFVARDTVTKKNYTFVAKLPGGDYYAPQNSVLTMLFDVMKERHDARNIFLFLIGDDASASSAAQIMARAGSSAELSYEHASHTVRNTEQLVVPNGAADCNIVVLASAMKLKENTFAGLKTNGMSPEVIAQKFIAAQKRAGANRVFVNTLIPYIA